MKITYVGHSCFLYENEDGGKIVFDPYKPGSGPGYADMDIAADEIVVSHGHADHSGDAYVDKAEPPYDGEFEIGVLKTYHDSKMGLIRGRNNISIVNIDGLRVVHMGDIGCELRQAELDILMHCDILMIPVGGYFTIGPRQAYEMVSKIDPKVVIPMHYRGEGFGYKEIGGKEDFLDLFADAARPVIRAGSEYAGPYDRKCVLSMEPLRIL